MNRNWNFMMEVPLTADQIEERELELGDAQRDMEIERNEWKYDDTRD